VASSETIHASVIAERRRFPRELPKPDVVELDSDSAWQAFQRPASADSEGLPESRAGLEEI